MIYKKIGTTFELYDEIKEKTYGIITGAQIENMLLVAINGGIEIDYPQTYKSCVDYGMPKYQGATQLLLEAKPIEINGYGEPNYITLNELSYGIKVFFENKNECNFDKLNFETVNCIINYAMELV